MNTSLAFPIHEVTEAGAARREATRWASGQGWSEEQTGRVALVVTELGRNLALHTKHGGTLLLRPMSRGAARGIEILSLDDGPGMVNFGECLRDGFSSIGTAGIGLGAVQRASQTFAVHSQPGLGTAMVSEIWSQGPELAGDRWRSHGISVPAPRELVCGDQWAESRPRPDAVRLIIADGLGHGEFAAQASRLAIEIFMGQPALELSALLEVMHGALRATRGAAVAVAEIDTAAGTIAYSGVGNIAGAIAHRTGATTSLVSMNGTIGAQVRGYRTFQSAFPPGAALVMASDGLKSQWALDRYPGLADRHPGLLAGVLYRDHLRGRDDATVVVLKEAA